MTHNGDFSIACVIQRNAAEYHAGNGSWDNNICRACLYEINQAEAKLKEIQVKYPKASISCVIQNKAFDYYDGSQFVYQLLGAKFYSYKEAREIVEKWSLQPNLSLLPIPGSNPGPATK